MTRRLFAGAALLSVLLSCGEGQGNEVDSTDSTPEDVRPSEVAQVLRADSRISDLLFPCARDEYFGEDTSELIPALLQKLETGQKDPLLRAQVALAARGEDALPGLRALTDRLLRAPEFHQRLHNVLGVVARMDPPLGRDIALRIVDAPNETLRLGSLQALERRASPEDYDRLKASLPHSSEVVAGVLIKVMARADASRLSRDLAQWIQAAENYSVWEAAAAALQEAPPPSPQGQILCDLTMDLSANAGLSLRTRLLALCVLSGTPESAELSLAELQERAVAKDPTERSLAIDGLRLAGRTDLLLPLVLQEKNARLREFAVGFIMAWAGTAEAAGDDQTSTRKEVLRRCLRDEDEGVRRVALEALVHELDREGIDLALTGLAGTRDELEDSIAALAPATAKDEELASVVFEVLARRFSMPELGPDLRMVAQALGRIPSEAAAQTLLHRARSAAGQIATMRSHRFLILQIANTGDAGLPVLLEALQETTDPLQRLDLLETLSTSRSERATEALVQILEEETERSGELADLEALYVAHRLLITRPAAMVAPLLKRTALRMENGEVRRALQCLLWRYFGPEN